MANNTNHSDYVGYDYTDDRNGKTQLCPDFVNCNNASNDFRDEIDYRNDVQDWNDTRRDLHDWNDTRRDFYDWNDNRHDFHEWNDNRRDLYDWNDTRRDFYDWNDEDDFNSYKEYVLYISYILQIIIGITSLLNFLVIATLMGKKNRRSSTSVYLTAMAVGDLLSSFVQWCGG